MTDPNLIPILGMVTGTVITLAIIVGIVRLTGGPVGQALGRRLRGGPDPEGWAELSRLRDEVQALRARLEETEERLDFAERMLAQRKADERVLPGF